ncbi:MAG: DnaJ domain-containing protein [Bacteroidales bacterium]|nr:DnaJ domain-containing protein [Bacteroidales bacterium]
MYFDDCHTEQEIKKRYHYWSMKLHPDRNNGNDVLFKIMLQEYEQLTKQQNRPKQEKRQTQTKNCEKEDINEIIKQLQRFQKEVLNPVKNAWDCFNDIFKKI